jgi:hypothetical protein
MRMALTAASARAYAGMTGPASRHGQTVPEIDPYKNITADTSPPFCPNGWLPPPESATLPEPPPDVQCAGGLPCNYTASDYINGGTWLFDVEGI